MIDKNEFINELEYKLTDSIRSKLDGASFHTFVKREKRGDNERNIEYLGITVGSGGFEDDSNYGFILNIVEDLLGKYEKKLVEKNPLFIYSEILDGSVKDKIKKLEGVGGTDNIEVKSLLFQILKVLSSADLTQNATLEQATVAREELRPSPMEA